MSQIIYNAIRTPDGTVLHSRHRHDYKEHLDAITGELYINDGGNDYQRRSVNTTPAEELSITMDDSHSVKRQFITWKTYGKDGEFPEGKLLKLCDMEVDHIRAILDTQHHIHGTYIEQLFADELEWREDNSVGTLGDFSEWLMAAQSGTIGPFGKPMPLITEILYGVCKNNEEQFKQVCDMMQVAFEAGQKFKE
jgi:hypothetical protein